MRPPDWPPVHGLEGLSIGDLAQHIGMSKSGLYAHFKSKEELELATIDTAAEIFESDVIQKVAQSLQGIARVNALTEAFFQHLVRRIFPGGCFFATVAAQLASHPGRARDRIMQMQSAWVVQFIAGLTPSTRRRGASTRRRPESAGFRDHGHVVSRELRLDRHGG